MAQKCTMPTESQETVTELIPVAPSDKVPISQMSNIKYVAGATKVSGSFQGMCRFISATAASLPYSLWLIPMEAKLPLRNA